MSSGASDFFTKQVEANTEAIAWAVGQVGPERFPATPPELLGEWPAARHLFHLLYYEREVALPSLSLWFGAPYPDFEGYNESAAWANAPQEDIVLAEIQALRARQLALVAGADDILWAEARRTPWGERTLYWVTSKTLQHALEHTNNILKIALLWEHYEARSRKKAAGVGETEETEIE
ncbi:MAG TPA: DinB family protein [Chloroflexia bacterium]|jgi:hypothetical protein